MKELISSHAAFGDPGAHARTCRRHQECSRAQGEHASAKTLIADDIAFMKSEPLIDHIDKNPFGVNAQVRKVITDSLTHMIKAIA